MTPLIKAWLSRLEEMSDPIHQMFTHIIVFNSAWVQLLNLCFDCSEEQVAWFESTINAILAEVGAGGCSAPWPHSWFAQLLHEAGVEHGAIENNVLALTDRHQGWGEGGLKQSSKNGGYFSYTYEMPDDFFDTLEQWTFGKMEEDLYKWDLMLMLYNLGGPVVNQVPNEDTPYRGRDAKFVVHFR